MKKGTLWVVVFLVVILGSWFMSSKSVWSMHGWPPTKMEVESYFKKNPMYSSPEVYTDTDEEHETAKYLRRHSSMRFGNIYTPRIMPFAFIYTPFYYFNYIDPRTSDFHSYVFVVTRDAGALVYNPVNGRYLGHFADLDDSDRSKEEIDKLSSDKLFNIRSQEVFDRQIIQLNKRIEILKQAQSGTEYTCSYNAYNCGDFYTHAQAQAIYDGCGGVNNDIHQLDRDLDGTACETLP